MNINKRDFLSTGRRREAIRPARAGKGVQRINPSVRVWAGVRLVEKVDG